MQQLTAATSCNMLQWWTAANCYDAGLQQNLTMPNCRTAAKCYKDGLQQNFITADFRKMLQWRTAAKCCNSRLHPNVTMADFTDSYSNGAGWEPKDSTKKT